MILDHIKNADIYAVLHPDFRAAFDFLRTRDLNALEAGRFDFGTGGNYVMVENYTTKHWEECKWESHIKYLDIQYIISGDEQMAWRGTEDLKISENRFAESDIAFYESDDKLVTTAILNEGHFAIFYPGDVHRPGACVDMPQTVKKIIFKLQVN